MRPKPPGRRASPIRPVPPARPFDLGRIRYSGAVLASAKPPLPPCGCRRTIPALYFAPQAKRKDDPFARTALEARRRRMPWLRPTTEGQTPKPGVALS